jgi:iron complex transport system substrate-binding protein
MDKIYMRKGLSVFPKAGKIPVLLLTAVLLILGGRQQGNLLAKGKEDSPLPQGESDLYWRLSRENNAAFIIDGAGNKVPLKEYRRIIVISPGAVEILYMIGAESTIAAITSGRDPIWPEEKTPSLPTVGNTARPSLEAIIALNPDLVIGNGMTAALMSDLAGRGYTVLLHNAESLADIFNSTIFLGKLSGKEEEARILAAEKEAQLETLKEELKKKPLNLKGAFLYSANPIMAFPDRSLPGEILRILGVENIAGGLNAAQPILSPEYILAQNPDFFFGAMSISKPEDILTADSVIAKTRAGMEKNISIVPSSLLMRTSPRIVDTLLELYEDIKAYSP